MKRLLASVVILSMSSVIAVHGADKKPASKIEGTWTVTGGISQGKKVLLFEKVTYVLVFKDGKYSETVNGKQTEAGTYKIDAMQNPITIDFAVSEGKQKGKIQLGIFKVDGESLTMALAEHGSRDRPKNLDGAGDTLLTILKRNQ